MFSEQSLGKINLKLFRNVSVHEFYRLKALITLEQVNTTDWSKKKKNLNQQNCDGRVCIALVGIFLFVCFTQNCIVLLLVTISDDLPSLYLISPSSLYPRQRLPEEKDASN